MTTSFLASRSPWPRLAIVAVWAVAFALVEAMVVYYLRKLFAIEFAAEFTERAFRFPKDYLVYEQGREAATMVMLVAVALLAGRTLWQAVSLLALRLRRLGHLLLRLALGPARLAELARHPRPALPHPRRVVGAGVAAGRRSRPGFIAVAVLILRFTRRA